VPVTVTVTCHRNDSIAFWPPSPVRLGLGVGTFWDHQSGGAAGGAGGTRCMGRTHIKQLTSVVTSALLNAYFAL
jgi:hypothetical protein